MIAVITLNYNQNDFTLKCVESILKSKFDDFKLFLVENGSTVENYSELRVQLPKDSKIKLRRLENNRGYVGGINYGLEEANKFNPDYFLIMNNDTILDESAISELKRTCDDYNQKAIVTGKVYHYDEPNKFQDIGYTFYDKNVLKISRIGLNEEDNGQYNRIEERDMLDDVFWLFPSKLYKEIGGYSPYFWFNAEQEDFALRAKENGYKLVYTPTAKIWHKGSVSIGGRDKNPRLAYFHIQSILMVTYLHSKKRHFIKFFFSTLLSVGASFLKGMAYLFIGKPRLFKFFLAKFWGVLYFVRWFFIRNNNKGRYPFN